MSIDIQQLYVRYSPMVLRRCRALLKNDERAAEAMQDVFVKLMATPSVHHDTGVCSLLFQMATQVCLNHLRSERRRPQGETPDLLFEIAASGDLEEQTTQRNWIRGLFHEHDVSTQVIAVMHFVDGMTWEEVAREVKLSVSGVRKKIRAMQEHLARKGCHYE